MDYQTPKIFFNLNDHKHIVSIGDLCPTSMALKSLNVYKESYPFDSINTTPKLILKYLKGQEDFFPPKKKDNPRNVDGVWFGHFNFDDKHEETIEIFKRRFERLYELLKNKKKILFVYTSESHIQNGLGMKPDYSLNYKQIEDIVDYIKDTYKYSDFKIICFHINKTYPDTENIVNYTINIPYEYLCENDRDLKMHDFKSMHRDTLKKLLNEINKSV